MFLTSAITPTINKQYHTKLNMTSTIMFKLL